MEENLLYKDEKLHKLITPHPLGYFNSYTIGGIIIFLSIFLLIFSYVIFNKLPGFFIGFCLFCLFIGVMVIIISELIRKGHEYYFTDKRVIHKFELLSKRISSVSYKNVQDFHFSQGLIERFFDVGTIFLNTAGSSIIEMEVPSIKNPSYIKKILDKYVVHNL